jgi:hypothetical protein
VGDPAVLQAALKLRDGVTAAPARYGIKITVVRSESIKLPAVRSIPGCQGRRPGSPGRVSGRRETNCSSAPTPARTGQLPPSGRYFYLACQTPRLLETIFQGRGERTSTNLPMQVRDRLVGGPRRRGDVEIRRMRTNATERMPAGPGCGRNGADRPRDKPSLATIFSILRPTDGDELPTGTQTTVERTQQKRRGECTKHQDMKETAMIDKALWRPAKEADCAIPAGYARGVLPRTSRRIYQACCGLPSSAHARPAESVPM